jgi:adenosylmethionine-8-amino-7-oxononanoate aminotransferase
VFITREHAYHGMHTAGTSLAGIPANVEGYGDLLGEVEKVAWNDAEALRDRISGVGAERVAAFFCEPVVGAGGVFPPPPGYLAEAREICRESGVLFVADEVITGFGRCGDWFASRRFDLKPDLITCAKGITSGYLPLGGVIAAPRVADVFWAQGAGVFRHGYTYSGHAAVAAAALANLDIMEQEGLLSRALDLEAQIPEALADLTGHAVVEEIRSGVGALAAVQLDTERLSADPFLAARAVSACRERGILTRALASGALQVSPTLVIEEGELSRIAEGFAAALSSL